MDLYAGGGFRGTEATPIVIAGLMYFSSPGGNVVALNAATGTEVWKYGLKAVTERGRGAKYGASYWSGDGRAQPRVVVARITRAPCRRQFQFNRAGTVKSLRSRPLAASIRMNSRCVNSRPQIRRLLEY